LPPRDPRGELSQASPIGDPFPTYRLFLALFGVAMAIALWQFLERTRLGLLVFKEFPFTPTGKVQRHVLTGQVLARRGQGRA
jgi:hypothetical protein